jgi:epoxyqueuosine reductase QueG
LERAGIHDGTVVIIAVPYFSKAALAKERNISAYAVSRDYHLFFQRLFAELIPLLQTSFPKNKFCGFADHSPIAECEAASKAGLGVIGKNHLLLTKKYSSYVFLGELITDMKIPCDVKVATYCNGCGACQTACPMETCGTCLSALTQKKGVLTEIEQANLITYGSAWGCDICQEVCPHTKAAIQNQTIFSPIPFFSEKTIPRLSASLLSSMTEEEFQHRAYAWRGRDTIMRNLQILETETSKKGESTCSD